MLTRLNSSFHSGYMFEPVTRCRGQLSRSMPGKAQSAAGNTTSYCTDSYTQNHLSAKNNKIEGAGKRREGGRERRQHLDG